LLTAASVELPKSKKKLEEFETAIDTEEFRAA